MAESNWEFAAIGAERFFSTVKVTADSTAVSAPPSAPLATSTPRKRRRPALSCEQCRRRKVKCDRSDPCKQCVQSKSKACTYTPQPTPKSKTSVGANPSAPGTYSVSSVVADRSRPAKSSASSNNSPSSSNVFDSVTAASTWSSPATDRQHDSAPNVQVLLERVQKLEQLLAESTSKVERLRQPTPVLSSPKVLRGTLSKTRFFGQSHWMHSFGVLDTLACIKENPVLYQAPTFTDEVAGTEILAVLERCKVMAKSAKQEIHNEWLMNPSVRDLVPPRELSDILIRLYFNTSESQYRILHIPSFQKEYAQYWEQQSAASIPFILKMLLAMANGAAFYQQADATDVRAQAKKWIFAANDWLCIMPDEKSHLNISGLQIHCLLILARQVQGVVGDLTWISTGSLVRAAFSMGFHRDPRYYPRMSPLHAELRRRLWATILELNIQTSLDSGMNPLVSTADFDTEPPANINDNDIDELTKVTPESKPQSVFTQMTAQRVLLESLPLRTRICCLVNDFRSEPCYDEVLELSAQITKACKDSIVSINNARSEDPSIRMTQFNRNLVDLSIRRFVLCLHRPYSFTAQADPRYYFSQKVSLDSAIIIITYPTDEAGTTTAPLTNYPRDEYTQYKITSGGLFKSVIIQSALAVFHEIKQSHKDDSPPTEHGRRIRAPLVDVLRSVLDLVAEKIGISENNVKCHLFISVVLGHVEALDQGKSPESGAIEAAKKSAKCCVELLGARLPALPASGGAQPQEPSDWRTGGPQVVPDSEMGEFGIQDWSVDLEMPDSWLFSGWEENRCW